MNSKTLNVHLLVDPERVVECAAHLQTQLAPNQWETLVALAAEIVARWETAAAGATRVVVVPAGTQVERVVRDLVKA